MADPSGRVPHRLADGLYRRSKTAAGYLRRPTFYAAYAPLCLLLKGGFSGLNAFNFSARGIELRTIVLWARDL
jgi:hypothetical protein